MMAYNRHFIYKRKNLKVNQTNTSAKVSAKNEEFGLERSVLPGNGVIEEARRTGELTLPEFGLIDIPDEIYFINRRDSRVLDNTDFENHGKVSSWWEDVLLTKLDLSSNRIAFISDKLRFLANLTHLDLHENLLKKLPLEINGLQQLTYLNLSKNQITRLPEGIGLLNFLKQLILTDNKMRDLPIEFCRLISLEYLDLSNNYFTYLPESIGNFLKLKHLAARGNKLHKLPDSLNRLKDLTFFDISTNKISTIPCDLEAKLEILNVSINQITTFPISKYTPTLQELYFNSNSISSLTAAQLSYIPNINVLSMAKNCIVDLPIEITALRSLTSLDISNNSINSIPYALGNMETLENLVVEGNPFRSISRTAITNGTERLKQYLRTRNTESELPVGIHSMSQASYAGLLSPTAAVSSTDSSLVIDVHQLNSIGCVDLSNRCLKIVPSDFFQALKLKKIRAALFAHNKLTVFPIGLTSFGLTLGRLDLSYNRLMDLPDCFSSFKCLQHFDLKGNYLRELPASIALLRSSLESLDVSHNPLGLELPDVIFQLSLLKVLNACHCSIVHINPSNFMQLPFLNTLNLTHNEIEILPPEFGLCSHIKQLNLDANKIRHPALTIMDYGTEAVFQYLRTQIPKTA